MAYDTILANRVREQLAAVPGLSIEEKKMFGGLAFLVNDKMCINITQDGLMCRYHPRLEDEVAERNGYQPMIMRGRQLKGYCYVAPEGFASKKDFNYWIKICLAYNKEAKASKKK
ncbi:MAG TPA: TfoX/Sxy family protein [Niabella sp.]|nr:TfoX/Sxy family protein [Niabella sp.]